MGDKVVMVMLMLFKVKSRTMKKLISLLSLVLITNITVANITSIDDSTRLSNENLLVLYGSFDKPDLSIDFEVYHSPLSGLVTDEWIPTVVLTNVNSSSVDFQIGFMYFVIIRQPDNSSRMLYINASIPDVVNMNIHLDNTWEGVLSYNDDAEQYTVHKFEKDE